MKPGVCPFSHGDLLFSCLVYRVQFSLSRLSIFLCVFELVLRDQIQIACNAPTPLTLTISDLENLMPFVRDPNVELSDLYPSLSKRQAYHTCLKEQGGAYPGPWMFHVELTPWCVGGK